MDLPTGTVTLLFTDIQDSTPLFHALGDRMVEVLDIHNALLREAFAARGGVEVKTEGDALFVGFADPREAILACIDGQRALMAYPWPGGNEVKVRMGLHRGPVHLVGHDYVGIHVAEAARVSAAAHGRQILVSQDLAVALDGSMPPEVGLLDLGEHVLKGFPEPRRLYEVRHDDLPSGFPPPNTLSATRHNLPVAPDALVGRADEIEAVTTLLLGEARLVTLTGPGGIGKSRLAIEAARRLLAYVRGGAWLVELAAVDDPAAIVPTIARALEVAERPGAALRDLLLERLNEEPTLLVIDNFEQVLDGAVAISELLAASPATSVLATSRERLRLRGEHEIVLEPLSVPGLTDDVASVDAGALFIARARAANATFEVDDVAARGVARVCARCDGIPLALELAAAHVRTMTPDQVADELARGTDLLSEGDRDLPERHRALQATIAWSYDALPEDARALFRRLGVFAGGAPLDAVASVTGFEPGPSLVALADRSMIRTGDRVRVLEPLRRYALARLAESGELADVSRRHAEHFLGLARTADAALVGPGQERWLHVLAVEHDNVRAALWGPAVEVGTRLDLAGSLGRFWEIRGHWTEGRALLAPVLALEGGEPMQRARALLAAGALEVAQGDRDTASAHLAEALGLAAMAGPSLEQGYVLNHLGTLALQRGDEDEARQRYADALDVMRACADARGIMLANNNLAALLARSGDLASARDAYAENLERARELGDLRHVAMTAQNLGLISQRLGDAEAARAHLGDALRGHRALGARRGVVTTLTNLGVLTFRSGDRDGARSTWEEALSEARALGDRPIEAQLLTNLIAVCDPAEALGYGTAAADTYERLGDHPRAWSPLVIAAGRAYAVEREAAEQAFARARSMVERLGDEAALAAVLVAHGRAVAAAGEVETARALGEAAVAVATAAGAEDEQKAAQDLLRGLLT